MQGGLSGGFAVSHVTVLCDEASLVRRHFWPIPQVYSNAFRVPSVHPNTSYHTSLSDPDQYTIRAEGLRGTANSCSLPVTPSHATNFPHSSSTLSQSPLLTKTTECDSLRNVQLLLEPVDNRQIFAPTGVIPHPHRCELSLRICVTATTHGCPHHLQTPCHMTPQSTRVVLVGADFPLVVFLDDTIPMMYFALSVRRCPPMVWSSPWRRT